MKRETLSLVELGGLAVLGYFAVQWWRDRGAGTAPPAPVTPERPTTPATLPSKPSKVAWPDGDLAPARARAQGFRPKASATTVQAERARSYLPQWDPRSAWPDAADANVLYVAATHGGKRAVEVWERAGIAPAQKTYPVSAQLKLLAQLAAVSSDPAQLRAYAATAATMGPAGQQAAGVWNQKARAIEAAREG
jgi:hypothetical protein